MTAASRVAYLDCSSGVSGDKFLGALLDFGEANGEFTADHLRAAVSSLAPEAHIDVRRVLSHGVTAVGVNVVSEESVARHWSDIRTLIANAESLAEPARESALRAFEAIAVAEAAVHGVDVDGVHFHEVGAIDSIVDVVGVCVGIHALGIGRLVASPVAVGSGTVATSHGVLPVPAPATAALLRGLPIVPGPAAGELTTPTGAALVAELASEFGAPPAMTLTGGGYGAGTRDIGSPNVCRVMVGESMQAAAENPPSGATPQLEPLVLLETNIDHIPAEELAFAAEELMSAGALDVWQTPIVMKKGRSAVMLSVLAAPADANSLAEQTIALTGSLGVRRTRIERSCVSRIVREVGTPWGPVRVKIGAGRVRPEHDDIARVAREHGLSYGAVAREIARLAEEPDPIDER
jgi:uncharacterized protein (TIGR00299 family) protein